MIIAPRLRYEFDDVGANVLRAIDHDPVLAVIEAATEARQRTRRQHPAARH